MQIYKTKGYERFKRIIGNRPVNEYHVQDLVRKISKNNLLEHFPIVVTKDDYIVDGQHRLAAARRMDLDVAVSTIDNTVDEVIVAIVNSSQRAWKIDDFVNFYAERGDEQYIFVKELREKHKLSSTVVVNLFSSNVSNKAIKEGRMVLYSNMGEKDLLLDMLDQYLSLRPVLPKHIFTDFDFVRALRKMFKQVDAQTIIDALNASGRDVVTQNREKDYLRFFEEVVNFKKKKNILRFF
jgi:hypothetical protein